MTVFATATGIGSWPGTSPAEAAEVVIGELHQMPHLVELPARGVGADLIGRAGALLVDLPLDTVPRGYRIASGRSSAMRRAASLLDEDLDALEEAWEKAGLRGGERVVKVQGPGPVTLAAQLELANGHRAITDRGAFRDVAMSLAEGMAAHRAEVSRRLQTRVVVQLDEPSLPAAVAGDLSGVTSLSPVAAVEESSVTALLDDCAAIIGPDIALHCCASGLPWNALRDCVVDAIAVDMHTLRTADLDGIGEFVETGRTVLLGAVASTEPAGRRSVEEVAAAVATITDRLGFPRSVLAERIGITPACGLAAATPRWARTAVELARKTAEALRADPDAI
ncbi:methionine synthase [Mycobacterium sp. pV006]|uniref:methionine synthase n=1 Tax=Mycobacterium sp. pV006 TaxID=3238983 RepID=UPI00351AED0E